MPTRAPAAADVISERRRWTRQLRCVHLERPNWVLVADTFSDHPGAARPVLSPAQLYRNASTQPSYRGWGFEGRVLTHFSRAAARTRSTNIQLTHTARARASGAGFLFNIFMKRPRGAAGFGACIPAPERANPLADRDAAFVIQSKPRTIRIRAFARRGINCRDALPAEE